MAIQSLEQFQKTFDSKPVEVVLDKFGKDAAFYLKPLTSADRDSYESSIVGLDGKRNLLNLRARLVALCLCNAKGEPIAKAADLGKLRADLVGALFDEIRHMNGMDVEDVDHAGKD